MKRTYLFVKYRIVCLWAIVAVFSIAAWAAEFGGRGREYGRSEVDIRRQQMEQEAQAIASVVQKALTDLLEPVRENHRPSQDLIQKSQLVLVSTKRYFPGFADKPKAQFMLLQAWTAFYQDDSDLGQALNWSIRACTTDETSQDAWISQAVFGLLNGRPPAIPRIEERRPQPQPDRTMGRKSRRNIPPVVTRPQPYSEKGILEFDLLGLNIRMFREQFDKVEFQTTAGEKIAYTPGTDTLCMLFWQDIPAVPTETGNLPRQPANGSQDEVQRAIQEALQQGVPEMADDMSMAVGDWYGDSQKTGIENQRSYFEVLMDACKDTPEIKFLQVNTFKPSLSGAVDVLPDDGQGPIPTVIAASPQSNAQRFAGWPAAKPFMAIVDKEGRVRYAGAAADFVPAFILTELTGVPIDLEKYNEAATMARHTDDPMSDEMMLMEGYWVPDPNRPAADPNKPTVDPNAVTVQQSGASRFSKTSTQQTDDELSIEYQAGKDLEYAETFIDLAKKRAMTYKKGVDLCREIIQKYPGTKYEDAARLLLREIPEHKRSAFNITDEELRLP